MKLIKIMKIWTLGGLLCCPLLAGPRINNTLRHPNTHPSGTYVVNLATVLPKKNLGEQSRGHDLGTSSPTGTCEATQHITLP